MKTMYNCGCHPIYPNEGQFSAGNQADFCSKDGTHLERCPRCHSIDIFGDGANTFCNRCSTRYPSLTSEGILNRHRMREIMGAYKDYSSSLLAISKQIKAKQNVLIFSDNSVDSAFMAVSLFYFIGSGMILDDNANVTNRALVTEVYRELTGRDSYDKRTYRFITEWGDVKSHLRLDLSITPLIVRRSVQPLRIQDLREMEASHGKLQWDPSINNLVSTGGVIVIHSIHSSDFKSQEAKTYLSNQLYHYTQLLQPSPKVYMPSYNNIMLK